MAKAKQVQTTSQAICRRRDRLDIRKGYLILLARILFLAAAGYLLFTQVFLITRATGSGMFPAVKDGDLLLVFRLQQDYGKDDVVVFEVEDRALTGRILAREGDVVTLDESGILLVNGTAQTGEIVFPTYAQEGYEYPLRIPEGCLFLLGDHRVQTEDSRTLGPIPMEQVEGKVITILRRRGI